MSIFSLGLLFSGRLVDMLVAWAVRVPTWLVHAAEGLIAKPPAAYQP